MQRTMSVYSSQFSKIKEAADTAAPADAGGGEGPLDSAVLSIMSASFAAMWDAVGEQGMRPFVVSQTVCYIYVLPGTAAGVQTAERPASLISSM